MLQNIMSLVGKGNNFKLFGGKLVGLGGDFRKILRIIIRKALRKNIVGSAVNAYEIRKSVRYQHLRQT